MKIFVRVVIVAFVGLAAFAIAARSGWLSPSEEELRAKYMLPTSRFTEIDGEPIHYSDEGQGVPIVMVHGTFGNLRMWNDWVAALGGRYRVIRFDRPPYGLSGPDPNDRYGPDREAEIIEKLVAQLGIDRFFLVATSSGGQSVTQYAAEHPEQIIGLVVSNIAVKQQAADPHRNTWRVRQSRKVSAYLNGWHPAFEWRDVLKTNFINEDRITEALVAEYRELNGRPASFLASKAPRLPRADRTPGDLARITAPTLVLWSENDSERPPQEFAVEAMKLLGASDKSLVIVPRCEHMMPVDCGPESAVPAVAFFDRVTAAGP